MASSGSFSGSIHSGHYVLRVDWTQTKKYICQYQHGHSESLSGQ